MIALTRAWMKLAMAIALVVGCNVAAPAIGAAANAAIVTSDMPCHDHQGGSDAGLTLCGKACLAIPAMAPAIMPAVSAPAAIFAPPLPVFTGQISSPDTPPPRVAEQA